MSGIFMDGQMKGYIFAVLSSLLVSSSFIINYVALQSVNITTLMFYFFGFGVIGAFILLVITKKLERTRFLLRNHWKPIAVLGFVGGILSIFWLLALKLVGSSTLGFLMRFSTIFTVALGVVYLKEKFNKGEILGAVIMILGAFLITFKGGEHIITGVFLALFISFVVSLEQLFMKNYVKHIEPVVFNALRLVFTFLVVSIYVISRMNLVIPPPSIMLLVFIGANLSAVAGFVFFFKALEVAELSKVAIIRALDPFVIFIYSMVFLDNFPTGLQLVGGMFIGVGALFLVIARHRPKIIEKILTFS
ncbi:MAG: DMT family transporter [Candidatus Aenigmatarchaeota archaeon]